MKINALFIVAMMGILALCFTSCEKRGTDISSKTLFNPSEEFSIILSKALHDNEDLREFIKNEALIQFDKDFDVFYPWAKGRTVNNGETFESILRKYDNDLLLDRIVDALPRLNISVPDWSAFEGFSIKSWDTSDSDLSVAFVDDNGFLYTYNDGKEEFCLKDGQIPGFPTLIIKENKRMKQIPSAKSAKEPAFGFIDPAFDGGSTQETKVTSKYYDNILEIEDYSNFVSEQEIEEGFSSSVTAYELFKNNLSAAHRDYIYFGMDNEHKYGKYSFHLRETVTKIRFNSLNSLITEDGDFADCPTSYKTRRNAAKAKTLLKKFCYEGNLELYINAPLIAKNGVSPMGHSFISVSFNDAFQLERVHVEFKHKTWFTPRKYVYTVDADCFAPKWIKTNIALPKWDITDCSSIMAINVAEYDDQAFCERAIPIISSFAQNFTTEEDLMSNGQVSTNMIGNYLYRGNIVKDGYGVVSDCDAIESDFVVVDACDDLGTAYLNYTSPIILGPDTVNGVKGYRIREINTGYVCMLILPKYE